MLAEKKTQMFDETFLAKAPLSKAKLIAGYAVRRG